MRLAAIAEFCARKVGINDNLTRAEAAVYAQARWKMIWDLRLWRQSLVTHTQTIPAGTSEVTLTDDTLERMVNARFGDTQSIEGTAADLAFRTDPTAWDTEGRSIAYTERPRGEDRLIKIRLLPATSEEKDLLCLCKRKCPEMEDDNDSPTLDGVDQALCAFVLGDLCQWLRQYSKANIHFEEAGAHVQTMIDRDTNQAAASQRLTPEANNGFAGSLPWTC